MSPTLTLRRVKREGRIELCDHLPWPLYLRRLGREGVAESLVLREFPCEVFFGLLWISVPPDRDVFIFAIVFNNEFSVVGQY